MAKFTIIAACVLLFACSTQASSTSTVMDSILTTMTTIKEQIESYMSTLSSSMEEIITEAETMSSDAIAAVDEALAAYNEELATLFGTEEADLDSCLALSDDTSEAAAEALLEVTSCIETKVAEMQAEYDELYAAYEEAFTIFSEIISDAESCDTSSWFSALICYAELMASGMTDSIASMETITGNITALQSSMDELSVELAACGSTTITATVTEQTAASLVDMIACTLELA